MSKLSSSFYELQATTHILIQQNNLMRDALQRIKDTPADLTHEEFIILTIAIASNSLNRVKELDEKAQTNK